jgi:hypothetical protein
MEAITNAGLPEPLAVFPISDVHSALAEAMENKLKKHPPVLTPRTDSKIKNQIRERMKNEAYFPAWETKNLANFDDDLKVALKKWGSVVIKPLHGYQGIGVNFINSGSDIPGAKTNLLEAIETLNARIEGLTSHERVSVSSKFLIEEKIESSEFAIDGVVSRGRLVFAEICEKGEMSKGFQEDQRYFTPPNLPVEVERSARNAVELLARSYPELTSAFHIEFKYKGNQAIIIDIGLRMGGAGLSDLIHFNSSGVSLFGVWLDALLGKTDPPIVSMKRNPTLLYLGQVRNGGIVKRVPLVTEIGLSKTVRVPMEFQFCKTGDCLKPFPQYTGHPNTALLVFPADELGMIEMERSQSICEKYLNPVYVENQIGREINEL